MKKYILLFLILCGSSLVLTSCSKDDQDDVISEEDSTGLGVNKFVYKGLSAFYLYKDKNRVLADNYFSNEQEQNEYLNTFDAPEDLFSELIYKKDRFSLIIPDYEELLKSLNGISRNNGMNFVLYHLKQGSNEVFGVVRYVLPHTSAEDKGVKRGMIFNKIDGQQLTTGNYNDLLSGDSYTIGLADLEGADEQIELVSRDDEISLTKEADYTENPVYKHKAIDKGGHKIGYLLYNAFISDFDKDLNEVFGDFKSKGITDLVVDLRYNGGGSVESSKDLASMITGQFENKIFATEKYNEHFQDDTLFFDNEIRDGSPINKLKLKKVYLLTSENTASASELLINSLRPYIDVVQVGGQTVGKFQASITVFNSDDLINPPTNPSHTYAMQPLILKMANKEGYTEYFEGLKPDVEYIETPRDLGELGDPEEPLLRKAIENMTSSTQGITTFGQRRYSTSFKQVGESQESQLNYRRMYTEKK